MQITETNAEGLRRDFKVVVPAQDIAARINNRLSEIGQTVRMPGFRPGKIPMPLLKQRYGQSVMGEVLDRAVSDSSARAISDNQLRPALQPRVEVTRFEEGSDLEFNMQVELLPEFEPADLAAVEIERPVAEVTDEQVGETLGRLAAQRKTSEPVAKKRAAKEGDIAVIDFKGSVDGETRPGMTGEGVELELGTKSFIDTFEEQLVGAKPGEHRTVEVTFPDPYPGSPDLAGKKAVFEVDVKELRTAKVPDIDDEFAKSIGYDDLAALKAAVRERMEGEHGSLSRLRAKRALLDRLAELHDFAVPQGMVDIEFNAIWQRLQEELKRNGPDPEDKDKSEDELKAEYRAIAERRVRLGLLLSEIGRRNNIQVTREELGRAVITEAQRFPGQERQVFEFFQKNPDAVESLRAPVFEDKVVDFVLGQIKVNDRTVSLDELMRDPDEEGAEPATESKPAAKPKAKKARS
jgi:trigger factor